MVHKMLCEIAIWQSELLDGGLSWDYGHIINCKGTHSRPRHEKWPDIVIEASNDLGAAKSLFQALIDAQDLRIGGGIDHRPDCLLPSALRWNNGKDDIGSALIEVFERYEGFVRGAIGWVCELGPVLARFHSVG
jgi:hypothetical protein